MGHTPLPAPTLFGAPPVEKHFLNDLSQFPVEFPPPFPLPLNHFPRQDERGEQE
jgi:hypothetical protein